MKKILSIFILAVAGILAAQASQVVKVVYNGTSRSITFRTNNVSASRVYYALSTNASPTFSSSVTPTNSGNYSTFSISSGSTNTTANKTIQIQLDDAVTFFEITSNPTYASTIDFSNATNLASISLKGCTGLTAMTLGTMSALTDIDVSNTSAAVANAITAAKCPALENLNVANCGLTSLAYTGTTLYSLDVTGNSIATLNLSGNSNLDMVRCESNSMTSLTVSAAVTTISAQSNSLSTLTGYGEPIQILDVASNGLTTLSMEGLNGLTDLDISSNHLTFRSFPSAEFKPARILYSGNDGQYDFSGSMKAAFGSYSYPLQSKLPSYSSRNESTYTIDLTEARLDGHGVQSVVPVVNSYNGTTDTPLTLSTSDVDGRDYAKSTDENLYGFMKPQERVRFSFTNANYPGVTLYSNEFTVPDGVTGTLKIVDAGGTELYSLSNAFFSDATDGLPADARRDYTKYTYPAMPTTAGQTWTVTAGPSDDAPFAWASSYESATWYYLGLKGKWVTAGEQLYELGGSQGNNGHKLKDSYNTSDNNYQWAFVGNQYDGFKIYNKGRGNGQTLQDYAGFNTVSNQYGYFPVMKAGESLKWIVRTNSAGTGFSLENKAGGTDYSNGSGGVSAPAFLNDFQGLGGMNYWITADYDAQNDLGSLFTVEEASGALSTTVNWIIVDGNNTPIYSLTTSATAGATVSAYPTELTTMASQRFVTLPALTAFTVASGTNDKLIPYTWTGPFQISTAGNEHHYQLKIRNALYVTSNTMAGGQLDCTTSSEVTNDQRWMFFGDPFNGFIIRNYAKSGQALAAANGTATNGSSFPTFQTEGTRWIITTCTQAGFTNPFSIAPEGTTGVYWNQYGGINNNQGVKYWTANGTSDGGGAIQAIEIVDAVSDVPITWTIVDGEGNEMFSTTVNHAYGSTVSSYPSELTAFADRFVGYPTLSPFTASEAKEVQVTYNWTGPFQLTTDTDNPHLYFFKSTRYSYYAYAPDSPTGQAKQGSGTKNWVTPRGRWFFTGDPFNGIEIRPYAYPETGLVNSMLSTTPTKYIPKANPDITTNYWDNALPSAAISFVIPNSSNCLAEQLGTWSSASINSDKGLSFVVEEADDISMLVAPGFYRVRCMGSGLTTKYWKLDSSDHKLYNNGDTENMNTIFRIEENVNADNNLPESYYIAGFDGDNAWYFDNSRDSYSQQFTTTQTEANYVPAQIIYNAKSGDIPYYAIKLSTQSSYSGYSYANTNTNDTKVVTWLYTDGTADGSAWALEPVAVAPTATDIYTINNGYAYRGALMSAPSQSEKWVWDSGKNSQTYDATSANCQWIFVPTGTADQYYLYNVGKQKFVVPTKSGGWNSGSNYTWMFSSDAVPLQLVQQDNGTYKMSTVSGDIYLSISNNNTGPVINYNDNGAKFMITKRGTASNEVSAQLAAALAAKPEGTRSVALNAVGDKSYATLYLDYDAQTDANTKAYYIETTNNGYAQLTEVANEGRNIPAYTAVVLINENAYTNVDFGAGFSVSNGYAGAVAETTNLLKGTLTSMELDLSDASNYYSMGRKDGKIGFYKFQSGNTTTITLGANKAYLETPASGGSVKGFTFNFNTTNSIETLNNGQWTMDNAEIYNLAGQKLNKPMKGVNIINGKKVMIIK